MTAAEQLGSFLPDERSAALVTSDESLRYLCKSEVDSAIALISKEARFLFVGKGVFVSAEGFRVFALSNLKQILDILVKYGIKKLYIENDKMTVAEFDLLKNTLHYADFITNGELTAALLRMRSIKSESEIACVKKAQMVCDKAYQRLLMTVRKGMTERQISAYLNYFLVEFGADEPAFSSKALSGENSANPKARPSSRQIREGDFLLLEFGARVGGYCAKMARTVAVGEISSKQNDAYIAVSGAVFDGLKTLRADISSNVPDSVARATLNAWNVEKYARGSFAHGIGIDVSEPPFLGENSGTMLKAGMTLAVGCDIRVPERFGVKITDTCALTEDGCVNFTTATRDLVHI
ncbi:MAG: aminopeptidase P family protein [Oscillospiraceae bacterium]|nr:aminopeptidase P family protein [Oscillospiraceae bacterium]